MSRLTLRRSAALIAGGAVVASGLVAAGPGAPAAHASAAEATGTGSTWLLDQLTDGVVDGGVFTDYSTTVDIALALRAIGGHDTDIDAIASTLDTRLTGASGYIEADEYDWQPPYALKQRGLYAGPTAKALYFAQVTGQDLTTYGGGQLVEMLEARTDDVTGAIHDDSSFGDYGNTIGQAYAAKALTTAGSADADEALEWLLDHQCTGGGFSLDIGQSAGSCTTNADADPDVTSFFLILFRDNAETIPRIARAVGKAEAWLMARQNADGSFDGGASTDYPNTNSTGLAGWALGDLGDVEAAQNAAVWLRRHQVQSVSGCTSALSSEVGAIAYDDSALTAGRRDGITSSKQYQWRLGTVQALPALRWAPSGTSSPVLAGPTAYVPVGGRVTVKATGLTPGEWACATGGSVSSADAAGTANLAARVPGGSTGTKTLVLEVADGTSATATVKALAAKTFRPTVARATVRRGASQTVRVSGLAAGEPIKVVYGGRTIRTAKASASGSYAVSFPVGRSRGLKSVKIRGAFSNRAGTKTFRVS